MLGVAINVKETASEFKLSKRSTCQDSLDQSMLGVSLNDKETASHFSQSWQVDLLDNLDSESESKLSKRSTSQSWQVDLLDNLDSESESKLSKRSTCQEKQAWQVDLLDNLDSESESKLSKRSTSQSWQVDLLDNLDSESESKLSKRSTCQDCEKTFSTRSHLLRHMRQKHTESSCDICGQSFWHLDDLKEHTKKHFRTPCDENSCVDDHNESHDHNKSHDHNESHDHNKSHDHNESHEGSLGGVSVNDEVNASTSKSFKRPTCQECGKTFALRANLKLHKKSHMPNMIRCSECSQFFTSEDDKFAHIREKHPESVCDICGKTFSRFHSLKRHMKKHDKNAKANFTCSFEGCDKSFEKQQHYQFHMNIHTGQEPYKCQSCGSTFRSKYVRNSHYKVCAGLAMLRCDICQKTFNARSSLYSHKESKHPGQNYTCRCGASFIYLEKLQKHKKAKGHD